ncbi:hypothetical protein I7I48_05897 [Histoplasma ohiense]|nr:hypothetical protein I7I48_05897 [Histoplasma ohiense (nom. inval.)]
MESIVACLQNGERRTRALPTRFSHDATYAYGLFQELGVSPLSFKFGDVGDGRGTSLSFLCDVPSQPTRILVLKFLQCFPSELQICGRGFEKVRADSKYIIFT